jgi:hypothetical protein
VSALDGLRGLVPDASIVELERMAAEVAEAASSPQALRRFERDAARQAAPGAIEAAYSKQVEHDDHELGRAGVRL